MDQVLAPCLWSGDVVVLDNLGRHKGRHVREMIAVAVARTMIVPPSSPDVNPIAMAFAKIKALLRKAAERTVADLWHRIGEILELVTPDEARADVRAAGYDPHRARSAQERPPALVDRGRRL